jgi:hypothetical protein
MNLINRTAVFSALCLAALPVAPVYAANWVYVVTSAKNTDYYYDADTLQRSGDQVTVWLRLDHSRDKTKKQRESKDWYRYNCVKRTFTLLYTVNYYPDGKSVSFSYDTYEQRVNPVVPGSLAEDLLEVICK